MCQKYNLKYKIQFTYNVFAGHIIGKKQSEGQSYLGSQSFNLLSLLSYYKKLLVRVVGSSPNCLLEDNAFRFSKITTRRTLLIKLIHI